MEGVRRYLSSASPSGGGRISFGVVPHAGWIYSGRVAGTVYSKIIPAQTCIFLATNHTGLGPRTSIFPDGTWQMPLGSFEVDNGLAQRILKHSKSMTPDTEAHLYEHAIEVQLPFLNAMNPHSRIVCIEMQDYRWETCSDTAISVAHAIEETLHDSPDASFAVLASSDMTHCGESYGQLPPPNITAGDFAKQHDQPALEKMIHMDPRGLLETVKTKKITMCGSGPAAAVIECARLLGAQKGQLLTYATSADVSGPDSDMAVGYAGMVFH